MDIPEDEVKVVKTNDQVSPKAVEVIQVPAEADTKETKEAKKD